MRTTATLAVVLASLVVAAGCRRRDADERANQQAEHIAQETTITSGELDRGRDETDESLRKRADDLVAFRRDQIDFQDRLKKDIDAIDGQVATLRAAIEARGPSDSRDDTVRMRTLLARRELLKGDLEAIERSTEADWPAVKTRIGHDLQPAIPIEPRSDRPAGQQP
jgi:hypothetical protein